MFVVSYINCIVRKVTHIHIQSYNTYPEGYFKSNKMQKCILKCRIKIDLFREIKVDLRSIMFEHIYEIIKRTILLRKKLVECKISK